MEQINIRIKVSRTNKQFKPPHGDTIYEDIDFHLRIPMVSEKGTNIRVFDFGFSLPNHLLVPNELPFGLLHIEVNNFSTFVSTHQTSYWIDNSLLVSTVRK
ncbi:hypothetical protein YC2023_094631 [Brassica napus]